MKKIDLSDYPIKGQDENGKEKEVPYKVKDSMVNILMAPVLELVGRDLLIAHKLASKIEECKSDEILLEAVEYEKLTHAVNTIKGFSKNDVEFVRRILEAETVPVKEDKT